MTLVRIKSDNWSVYIILCSDNTLYTGITNDIRKRFAAHKLGKGAKYTAQRGVKEVVYSESFLTKSQALKREYEIKKLSKQQKLILVSSKAF